MKLSRFLLLSLLSGIFQVQAQYTETDRTYKKWFVGSTAFVLANLIPDDNPPNLGQLNIGYRITGKDVVALELKTWKYGWPIGIPYGSSFEEIGRAHV